MDVCLL